MVQYQPGAADQMITIRGTTPSKIRAFAALKHTGVLTQCPRGKTLALTSETVAAHQCRKVQRSFPKYLESIILQSQ